MVDYRNVRNWRQHQKNEKQKDDAEKDESSGDVTSTSKTGNEAEGDSVNTDMANGDTATDNDTAKSDTAVNNDMPSNNESSALASNEDIDIMDNAECKFNVNSFKIVYVVNSEYYLYKRTALKKAKEVSNTAVRPRISGLFTLISRHMFGN